MFFDILCKLILSLLSFAMGMFIGDSIIEGNGYKAICYGPQLELAFSGVYYGMMMITERIT